MKKKKGQIKKQRAWRAKKKDAAEKETVSKDLSEARIANCYYPEDNKTVTIFADSERGKHERARRRTERTTRTKKRERRQTGKDDERIGVLRGTRAAERRREGRTDAAVHLGTRKKENQMGEREVRDKEKDLSGSGHPAVPFHPLRHPSAFFAVPSFALPRTLVPSSRPLLFDDSFRHYYSYRTTPTAEESSFCEI